MRWNPILLVLMTAGVVAPLMFMFGYTMGFKANVQKEAANLLKKSKDAVIEKTTNPIKNLFNEKR